MTDPTGPAPYDALRKQAKRWLRALRSGDPDALARLERVLPRHGDPPVLREVQQALAREHGHASWAELKESTLDGASDAVATFLEYACIFTPPTDFPSKWRRAERIRARDPGLPTATLHTAIVCGEVEHVRTVLDANPAAISQRGGPQEWEPLLFACYARLPNERASENALAIAKLLLERGADPNAHFVTRDEWRLRFNALTGVMGQGEMGQPEHPAADAVARLLLERGADANDSQGLYNTHLVGDDVRWLELLAEFGLGPDAPVNWHADPADAPKSGADRVGSIFDFLAPHAARRGHERRLRWLLEHGADPNARSIHDGRSCRQLAEIHGSEATLRALREHGAADDPLDAYDGFVAAARRGDVEAARAMLLEHPEYADRGDALTDAASLEETEVVRALLQAGVDANASSQHGHRALHNGSAYREIALLLLAAGADPRSRAFGGTACAWALNAGHPEMARFHAEQSRSLLDAVASGHAALVDALLAEDPTCIGERSPGGNGALHETTGDPTLAEPIVRSLLEHGADPDATNDAGQTAEQHLDARGADEVADLIGALRET